MLKKLKLKKEKRKKKGRQKKKRGKKENSTELQKLNTEAKLYNNSKKCD